MACVSRENEYTDILNSRLVVCPLAVTVVHLIPSPSNPDYIKLREAFTNLRLPHPLSLWAGPDSQVTTTKEPSQPTKCKLYIKIKAGIFLLKCPKINKSKTKYFRPQQCGTV